MLGDDNEANADEVDLVQLENKYAGNRTFDVTIKDNLITGTRQLIVLDGTDIFAMFSFAKGGDEAQALVEAVKGSRTFTATKIASGVLKDILQVRMTAGTNPTVTTESYSKGTELLERYRWNCIVADTDDTDVQTLLINFVKQSYETGHLGFACIAGLSSQALEDRMAMATSINDEKVVYVLNNE